MTKAIKKHKRREIVEWKSKAIKSYWIFLYVAGNYSVCEKVCREACFPSGLCVTLERCKYIFGGGSEDGVRVGFIDYPPFPEASTTDLFDKAVSLGEKLVEANFQFSFSIVTPDNTVFFSRVK